MINFILLLLLLLFFILLLLKYHRTTEKFYSPNQLEFVHIPKNAGTSIENAAEKAGIKWGFKQWSKRGIDFHNFNLFKINANWYNTKYNVDYKSKDTTDSYCFPWHEVPDNFDSPIYGKEVKTFCVVRDPYDKIVSAYKYYKGKNASKEDLNNFIREKLLQFKDPRWNSGHILPQYLYTHGKKKCDYILRFENLNEDFDKLMKKFNINNIKLEKDNKSSKKLCKDDLTEESKHLIRKAYKQDFELFNYKM